MSWHKIGLDHVDKNLLFGHLFPTLGGLISKHIVPTPGFNPGMFELPWPNDLPCAQLFETIKELN